MTNRDSDAMRVLFLTSNLGFGHVAAAKAIGAGLRRLDPDTECEVLDLWSLMDERVAGAVKDGYLRLTQNHPAWYQRLYDLDRGLLHQLSGRDPVDPGMRDFLDTQLRRWFPGEPPRLPLNRSQFDQALIRSLISLLCQKRPPLSQKIILRSLLVLMRATLVNRMQERVEAFDPHLVVATQMYPAALWSSLREKDCFNAVPTVGVVTDYGLQSTWLQQSLDAYCVASPALAEQLVTSGIDSSRVHYTGMPLAPSFASAPDTHAARHELGLDPDRPTVLVTGGLYGIGIARVIDDLLSCHPDHQVIVVCGHSKVLARRLEQRRRRFPHRLLCFRWVEDMAPLLAAADVVVGKPGGLSVSEALACGKPFFATCSLGGQERHNADFVAQNGVGCHVAPDNLSRALGDLFAHPERLTAMTGRAIALGRRDGTARISQLLMKLHEQALAGAYVNTKAETV